MNEENVKPDAVNALCSVEENIEEKMTDTATAEEITAPDRPAASKEMPVANEANELFTQYLKTIAETERLKAQLEMAKKDADPTIMLKNPDNVKLIAQDEAVKKAVIEDYLMRVAGGGAVEVMSPSKGSGKPVTQFKPPKTLKEAARIASYLFEE